MTSLTNTISLQWDLWTGQYRAFFPTSEEDLKACQHLMATAGIEQGTSPAPGPANELAKLDGRLAACQNTMSGEMVACLRLVDALQMDTIPGNRRLFHFELFDEQQRQNEANRES